MFADYWFNCYKPSTAVTIRPFLISVFIDFIDSSVKPVFR